MTVTYRFDTKLTVKFLVKMAPNWLGMWTSRVNLSASPQNSRAVGLAERPTGESTRIVVPESGICPAEGTESRRREESARQPVFPFKQLRHSRSSTNKTASSMALTKLETEGSEGTESWLSGG